MYFNFFIFSDSYGISMWMHYVQISHQTSDIFTVADSPFSKLKTILALLFCPKPVKSILKWHIKIWKKPDPRTGFSKALWPLRLSENRMKGPSWLNFWCPKMMSSNKADKYLFACRFLRLRAELWQTKTTGTKHSEIELSGMANQRNMFWRPKEV